MDGTLVSSKIHPPTSIIAALSRRSDEPDHRAADLLSEMKRLWRSGERPTAEEFLDRYADLRSQPAAALRLIIEEFRQRRALGEPPAIAEFFERFPQWKPQLEILLASGVTQRAANPPQPWRSRKARREVLLPRVGDQIGDFLLLDELGRGATGCVFLAREPALADRPVVLKITLDAGDEHLSLARLQHTGIVPLFSVSHDEERNLRALCMPYFGSVTLGRVIEELLGVPQECRTGRHLVEIHDRADEELPVSWCGRGPASQFLVSATYVQALCWIGAAVADALHYAHEHDLVHLDVKPANILLSNTGQPMLLDFHLARPPLRPGEDVPERLGGTCVFMPREQHEALAALAKRQTVRLPLDGRADIFSLGATLYAMLGGQLPYLSHHSRPLHTINPQVSVGLSDVLARCLADRAEDRYPTAAAVAADLRRHLADRPLLGVPNRNWRERWDKWRRRRPQGVAFALLLTIVLAITGILGLSAWRHVARLRRDASSALEEGADLLHAGRPTEAGQRFRRGLEQAEGVPFDSELSGRLRAEIAQADELRVAQQGRERRQKLHSLTDRLRLLYAAQAPSSAEGGRLAELCAAVWANRAELLEGAAGQDLETTRIDLLDLVVLWADLHVRIGPSQNMDARRHAALAMLEDAERTLGGSAVLCLEQQALAESLRLFRTLEHLSDKAATLSPRTAWEHCALGLSLERRLSSCECAVWHIIQRCRAAAAFRTAVRLDPQGMWPNFHHGCCCYRLGRFHEAAAAFSVCVGAAPDSADVFWNRALANAALGDESAARADLDRANQSSLRHAANRADVLYNLAVARHQAGDRLSAHRFAEEALREDGAHRGSRKLREQLAMKPQTP